MTEVGQVFVRVNVSGDAISQLADISREIDNLIRQSAAAASRATPSSISATNTQSYTAEALAGGIDGVAESTDAANASVEEFNSKIASMQQEFQKAKVASTGFGQAGIELEIIQSKNAATLNDVRESFTRVISALIAAKKGTYDYEVALQTFYEVIGKANTGAGTLAKSFQEMGIAAIKNAALQSQGVQAIDNAYSRIKSTIDEYTKVLSQLSEYSGDINVEQEHMSRLQMELSKAFEDTTIKVIKQEQAIHGAEAALQIGKDAIRSYATELSSAGYEANNLKANIETLTRTVERQNAASERAREAEMVRGAREAISQAKMASRYTDLNNAILIITHAEEKYQESQKATALLQRERIRLTNDLADSLTRSAIDTAKALEKTKEYAEALKVVEQRRNAIMKGEVNRGSQETIRQLDSTIDRMKILKQEQATSWWDGPIGKLRNLSGTVLAITGAFYTLRDAITSIFDAMTAGAQLSIAEAQMKLLTTTTQEYEQALQAAGKNIELFGGSLATTLADMNRLVILSNQTSASVELLNQAVLLLSAKDPQQGAEGAVIALNEALGEGQTISLRRRFELVGSSISYFADEGLTANEKLARLIETLGDMGIDMALLEGSVGSAARSVNELGSVSEETWARIGQALSTTYVEELQALTEALRNANAQLAEYAKRQEEINSVMQPNLTQQQKDFVFNSPGARPGDQAAMIAAFRYINAQEELARATYLTSEAYISAAAQGDNYNIIMKEQLRIAEEQSLATAEVAQKIFESIRSQEFEANIKKDLISLGKDLVQGKINEAQVITTVEAKYGDLGFSAADLISALRALAQQGKDTGLALQDAAQKAANAWQMQMSAILIQRSAIGGTEVQRSDARIKELEMRLSNLAPLGENVLEREQIQNDLLEERFRRNESLRREAVNAEQAFIDSAIAMGKIDELTPKLQNYRKELERLSSLDAPTEEQRAMAVRLRGLISQLDSVVNPKVSGGGGGGGAARLSDQDKLNNQLALDQLKADQQAQDALIAHEERMLEIRKDYAERTLRAIEEFQEDQKSGRASFYESLTGIEDHGLQKAMSAQFEAAALEAGKIAQTLGPDVAAKFLQQMQKNITDQAKRQQDINKALDKNSNDFNPALAEYLQGVDQLFRVSEQGAINQILRARDSLAMSEQGAIQDAEQKYIDALAKISDTAAESAERRIEAVRLAGKEIDLEIAKVQELGATYEKIGFMPGSQRTVALQGNAFDPMASVSESLAAIAGDITSVLNAIRSNTGDTASAVRRLSPSVTQ